ncbi:hypothetical protein D3C81_2179150 [compost metagenome]
MGVVLGDTHGAHTRLGQQLLFIAGGVFLHQAHGFGFTLQRLDQEAADAVHRHALQLLGVLLGFRCVVLACQMDMADTLQDRF